MSHQPSDLPYVAEEANHDEPQGLNSMHSSLSHHQSLVAVGASGLSQRLQSVTDINKRASSDGRVGVEGLPHSTDSEKQTEGESDGTAGWPPPTGNPTRRP